MTDGGFPMSTKSGQMSRPKGLQRFFWREGSCEILQGTGEIARETERCCRWMGKVATEMRCASCSYYKPYLGGIERVIQRLSVGLLGQPDVAATAVLTTHFAFPRRHMGRLPPIE
jgi:hypothetical protein